MPAMILGWWSNRCLLPHGTNAPTTAKRCRRRPNTKCRGYSC